MSEQYTSKVIYHETENGEPIRHVQLFHNIESAVIWGAIQRVRGFVPVEVENNAIVDEDMRHVGDVAPQVHQGHYVESRSVNPAYGPREDI